MQSPSSSIPWTAYMWWKSKDIFLNYGSLENDFQSLKIWMCLLGIAPHNVRHLCNIRSLNSLGHGLQMMKFSVCLFSHWMKIAWETFHDVVKIWNFECKSWWWIFVSVMMSSGDGILNAICNHWSFEMMSKFYRIDLNKF